MSVAIDWSAEASRDLLAIPSITAAEMIATAVRRYAEDGIGFVLHVPRPDEPDEFRLLIPRMRAYVRVRRSASTLYVERVIYRP